MPEDKTGPSREQEAQKGLSHQALEFLNDLFQRWESLSPEKRVYFAQLGLMVLVQGVDVLSSSVALETVPGAYQRNPIIRLFLDQRGMAAVGLVKTGVAIGQVAAMEIVRGRMGGEITPDINNILRVGTSVSTAVCANNAIILALG